MKMMMLCTHYITIAIVHIYYSCPLLFYRDASVPQLFRLLVDAIFKHPLY